jgi:hypothetical protein
LTPDEADREALLTATEQSMKSQGDPRQLSKAVRGLIQKTGATVPTTSPMSDPSFRAYADYFMGRALEEKSSANFRR